jgi:DNA-directed RNA polymerase subunit RPC12/RpoP
MVAPSPEAMTLRCERCGASFGFASHQGLVRCPHCGHERAVSPALRAELERYGANVQSELVQADHAYGRAAMWQRWADQGRRTTPGLKLLIRNASSGHGIPWMTMPCGKRAIHRFVRISRERRVRKSRSGRQMSKTAPSAHHPFKLAGSRE